MAYEPEDLGVFAVGSTHRARSPRAHLGQAVVDYLNLTEADYLSVLEESEGESVLLTPSRYAPVLTLRELAQHKVSPGTSTAGGRTRVSGAALAYLDLEDGTYIRIERVAEGWLARATPTPNPYQRHSP